MQNKADKSYIFTEMPIGKAVLSLAVPSVISQLIVVLYNMADTWYIGRIGDPYQVAAVTVAYPVFMLLNAIANLFAIGGGSLVSRIIGKGEKEEAKQYISYTIWASLAFSLVFSVIVLFLNQRPELLGADAVTAGYAADYLFWAVCIGSPFTILNLVLAGLLRSQGFAKVSSVGMTLGGVLNVVLDPVFIFLFGLEISGAAIATALSNLCSLVFLVLFVLRHKSELVVDISFRPAYIPLSSSKAVYSIGIPAALQIIMASVSNSFLIRLMSAYPVTAISGLGIMQKVEIIPFQIVMGISEGVLPLIAFNYASGNNKRRSDAVRYALFSGLLLSLLFFTICESFAPFLIGLFIPDSESIFYGSSFLRLRVLALPFITTEFMLIAVFQASGKAHQALILSLFRKGVIDLPLMLLMNHLWPMYGLMLVQPVMELSGALIATAMYRHMDKTSNIRRKGNEAALCRA